MVSNTYPGFMTSPSFKNTLTTVPTLMALSLVTSSLGLSESLEKCRRMRPLEIWSPGFTFHWTSLQQRSELVNRTFSVTILACLYHELLSQKLVPRPKMQMLGRIKFACMQTADAGRCRQITNKCWLVQLSDPITGVAFICELCAKRSDYCDWLICLIFKPANNRALLNFPIFKTKALDFRATGIKTQFFNSLLVIFSLIE